jgi:hypothetical protein
LPSARLGFSTDGLEVTLAGAVGAMLTHRATLGLSATQVGARLTVSEIFPLEVRAFTIAIFYAVGTLAGGVGAPFPFGWIIGTGSKAALPAGYLVGRPA